MVLPETIVVQVFNGLSIALSIAIVAIGLTLVFGIMDIVNFAHGEFYMMGGYGLIVLLPLVGNYWGALLIASLAVVAISLVMNKVTIEPILDRGPIVSLIVTFGLVLVFQRLAFEIFGGSPMALSPPVEGQLIVGGIVFPTMRLVIILGSSIIIFATWLFIDRTRMGILIRSTAQDAERAKTLGVSTDRIFTFTFALSAFLGAISAGFLAPLRSIYPSVGATVILDAFIVVIIGGMGSIPGVIIAALFLGILQALLVLFLPSYLTELITLFALIGVLMVRPEGIFGEAVGL